MGEQGKGLVHIDGERRTSSIEGGRGRYGGGGGDERVGETVRRGSAPRTPPSLRIRDVRKACLRDGYGAGSGEGLFPRDREVEIFQGSESARGIDQGAFVRVMALRDNRTHDDGMCGDLESVFYPAIETTDRVQKNRRAGGQIVPVDGGETRCALAAVHRGEAFRQPDLIGGEHVPGKGAGAENDVMRLGIAVTGLLVLDAIPAVVGAVIDLASMHT